MKKFVSLILLSIMLLGAWQFNSLISAEEKPILTNESVENKFEGKVISILGDSISTFAGYIPVADGFNLEHLARYPQDNLLNDVNETWWMQVINSLDAKLGINDSWRGATVSGAVPVTTGTTGENAAMSNLTRIQNLGSNGTPDIILFYGGTNDLAHVSKVGSFDPNTAPSVVDLTTKKWDNLADSYVHTLLRLRHYYPDAVIIAMLPTYTKSYYSSSKLAEANSVLAEICDYYGVSYVDLRDCGITTSDLPDGIHPDANGMDYIAEAVLDALLNEGEMKPGENVIHSVTHKLTGAKSSLGYYKGITHGKSFVTNIVGDNVTVSVTMGGVDITNSVYSGGVVNIPEVVGDIVITARGKIKPIYEDYLQNIPENICHKTNLWNELEHNREYYTASGWGVNSLSTVYSVTFPVKAGDQIFATSFGAAGTNGGTTNGIRLTWFNEEGVIKSLSPAETYAEFSKNGFLTAPDDAFAVNVVVWDVNKTNELYILNRDHNYQNGICTGCGLSKKTYQRLTYFTVDVEDESGNIYSDNAVLYLPDNYSIDGEPVKLIIYCKQGSSKITTSSNPIESVGFYNYLISLGYAVLGVDGVPDGWRDKLGLDDTRVVGNYLAVQGTEKAYEYVIENYNIAADECFISGYSQGGHYAQNVIDLTDIPIIAAAEQSPVCSMQYHQWDLNASVTVNGIKFTKAARLNLARIYGFPGVSNNSDLLNLKYDASLLAEYDPWIRNSQNVYSGFIQKSNLWYLPTGISLDDITMTKTVKCPIKIWCAEDDTALSADVMKVFVKAIQNAGGTAEISVASSGGHGFFTKQTPVGTFIENGKTYNTLPIAVEIAQWFEKHGGYACQHNYSDNICTICGETQPGPIITQQPTNDEAKLGENFIVEVKAEGENLKYQWYFRNAGSSKWYKSSVKDNTYDDVMIKSRAGREIYCVITDANGNSVTTDTVKLIRVAAEELKITAQPADSIAAFGEMFCATVEAQGEGIKYQWYFRNAGSEKWYKSSVKDNTYDDIMTPKRAGREIYCVITDALGNKVTTDIVTLIAIQKTPLKLLTQPESTCTKIGDDFCVTVEAEGDYLEYQWYLRNAGSDKWYKSSVKDNTYDDVMTKARANREIYCVITDASGNKITTDIVTLVAIPQTSLKLLAQAENTYTKMGEDFCVTVEAEGDLLEYQWYFQNAGSDKWYKSSVKDNTYDDVMTKSRANREVYCIITDACGNKLITEVVTIRLDESN